MKDKMIKNSVFLILVVSLFLTTKMALGNSFISLTVQGSVDLTKKTGIVLANKETGLLIYVSKYPFGSLEQQKADQSFYQIRLDNQQKFKIEIPSPSAQFYLRFFGGGGIGRIDNIFIVRAGDNLNVKFDASGVSFEGENQFLMKCQTEILKNKYSLSEKEGFLINSRRFKEYFRLYNMRSDSILLDRIDILNKYKKQLSPDLYEILLVNCYGLKYNEVRSLLIFSMNYPDLLRATKEYVKDYVFVKIPGEISETNKAESPLYTNYLLETYILNLYLSDSFSHLNQKGKAGFVFDEIVKNKPGIIRDKLLSLYSLRFLTDPAAVSYIDSAMILIRAPLYRKLLINNQAKFTKNAPFYNFNLLDSAGNLVKLSDFKDKVVFIDFWYTGCGGCAQVAKAMPHVMGKFISNDSVKFITISIDKNRMTWVNSGLKSGLYTHNEEINLFTNGEGENHPLITYYNISSYPRMFLIKNGKMYSSTPPRPGIGPDKQPTVETDELISLIKTALLNQD